MYSKKKEKKIKNKSYFSRFRSKFRRRREFKTDYKARKYLILQNKNKYNTPKFRLVVRITNKDIICQIISSKIIGDEIKCVAYSHELKRYGLKVGLKNWPASYATGLLCARRLLKKLGIDKIYEGKKIINGEFFLNERDESINENIINPFCSYLDVGLRRTTTGARIFAALKGATDGGLYIPHNSNGKQFPGWCKDEGGENYNSEKCKYYILGGHVSDYMKKMKSENLTKYEKHFSNYIIKGINSNNIKELYEKLHEAIRENPQATKPLILDKLRINKSFKKKKKII